MSKANGGHRNGSPDAADTLTPTRLAEIGGSIQIAQVQELRKIPSAFPSLFPPSRVQNYFLDIASPTSLRLTWSTPESDGGSTLLGYRIRVVNQDTGATVYESATYDSSPFVATGLTTGVSYQVRVAPVNAIGQGEEDFSDSIPGATIPGVPTGLSATAGDGTAALSWTAPANDGGGAIAGYVVEYTPAGGFAQTSGTGSAGTTFDLNSVNSTVTNGVTYSVRVAAANAAGQGPYSSAVNVTLPTVPGAPTALSGTAGNAQVPLTWTAPASNGGAAITGYVVECTPAGGSADTVNTGSATASYTKTGLTNDTAYTFRVAAINSAGTGPYSSSISVTPAAPAGGVTLLRGPQASGQDQWGFQHLTGSGTAADPFIVQSATDDVINFNPVWFISGTATMHVQVPTAFYEYDERNYQVSLRLRSGATLAAISSSRTAGTDILTAGLGTHSVSITNSFVRCNIISNGEYVGFTGLRIWFTDTTIDTSPLPAGTLLAGAGWTGEGRSSSRLTLSANRGEPWSMPVTASATGICVARLLSGDDYNDGSYAKIRINGAAVLGGHGTTTGSFPVISGQVITFSGDTGGVVILQGTTLYLI